MTDEEACKMAAQLRHAVEHEEEVTGRKSTCWHRDLKVITDLLKEKAALQQRVDELEGGLCFVGKWVERGLFCKTTSPKDALTLIAHYPGMPWNSQRWDVDHKPYAEKYYAMFPDTKENSDASSD